MNQDEDKQWVGIAANPYGDSNRVGQKIDQFQRELRKLGLEVQTAWTLEDRSQLVDSSRDDSTCLGLIAAGGDGTFAGLINEHPTKPVAQFPMGNENLVAQAFGYSKSPVQLAQQIRDARVRTIDLGDAGKQRFVLMLSVGFDAYVAAQVANQRKRKNSVRKVGRSSYVKPILNSIRTYAYDPIELEADGVKYTGSHALVFNIPEYGFGFRFLPESRPDDGLLNWLVFQKPGRVKLASYCLSVKLGRHLRRKDVCFGTARDIKITSQQPVPVQADGEAFGTTPMDISVVPSALKVLVPTSKE